MSNTTHAKHRGTRARAGVLALALSAGATMKEATGLANIAAGIVVGKVGTAAVSREELIDAL